MAHDWFHVERRLQMTYLGYPRLNNMHTHNTCRYNWLCAGIVGHARARASAPKAPWKKCKRFWKYCNGRTFFNREYFSILKRDSGSWQNQLPNEHFRFQKYSWVAPSWEGGYMGWLLPKPKLIRTLTLQSAEQGWWETTMTSITLRKLREIKSVICNQ